MNGGKTMKNTFANEAVRSDFVSEQSYENEIIAALKGNESPAAIRTKLEAYHENDLAGAMEEMSSPDRRKFCRIMDTSAMSGIFEYLEPEDAAVYLNEMDINKAAEVIAGLETDTAVDILRAEEKDRRTLLIDLLPNDIRGEIRLIASYSDDEIGSRMTANFILINKNIGIKEAMNELIHQAAENDNISTIFVSDESGLFYGAVDLKDLIIARDGTSLSDITVTAFPYVYGHETIDDCIEKLKDYSEDSIPVLDNDNKLLGVITAQSLIEVVDDEISEDYAMLAGLTAEEDLSEPLKESMKKRLPWLLVLLGLGLVVSGVVGVFERVVSQLTLIMAFQSLILDMAGNVGTQSLAVTIRVLTDENLTFKQKTHLVTKEMKVGLSNGLILGALSFLFVGLFIMLFKGREAVFSFAVSGCIGVSLMLAMLISSAVGTLIPLFFKKIKIDPAVASGPLITTINDLVAVVAYYGMSWLLLINVLHLAN